MTERQTSGDWRDRHLKACLMCGVVWRPRRRKSCPGCGEVDRWICLTCDRAWPADKFERQCSNPNTAMRELVKACAGDWKWAGRALLAAAGDVVRARVDLARTRRVQNGTTPTAPPSQEH